METLTPKQMEHQNDFIVWLRELRSPIVNSVLPASAKALAGYAAAPEAFAAGGQFDAITDGDYLVINQQFAAQFQALSGALNTTFEPPSDAMTLMDAAAWLRSIVVALDAAEPGLFGGISEE